MFSFSTISVFATLAFAALSAALPNAAVVGELKVVPAALPNLAGIVARDVAGVAAILTNTNKQLAPLAAQLKFVTPHNATMAAVSAPATQMKVILTSTIAQLTGLVGAPSTTIFASPTEDTELVSIGDIAALLTTLLTTVFEALGAVLAAVGATLDVVLVDLLAAVGALLGEVLALVLALVGGLVAPLLTALGL